MEFQTADSFALDKRGNKIAKRGKNAGYFTLKEWETAMGRDFGKSGDSRKNFSMRQVLTHW